MTRIGDLANSSLLQFFQQRTVSDLNDLSFQVSSGKVSQNFSGLPTQASRLVSLKNSFERTEQFITNISLVDDRLDLMENNTSQIYDVATQLNTLLVQVSNMDNIARDLGLNNTASNLMSQVGSLLNGEHNGRFLFAGSATNVAPVDLTDTTFAAGPPNTYPSAADTSYFKGNSTKLSVKADNNFTLSYGVTANEAGFEKLLRALNLATTASEGPPADTARIAEAHSLVQEALTEIPLIRSKIGGSRNSLSNVESRHQGFILITEDEISDIENVDVTEAISKFTEIQNSLQASYMTSIRIGELSLANFL